MAPIAAVSCALSWGPLCAPNCFTPFQYEVHDYSSYLTDCIVPRGYIDTIDLAYLNYSNFQHAYKNEGAVWRWSVGSNGVSGNLASEITASDRRLLLPAVPYPDPVRSNEDGVMLDVRIVQGRFTTHVIEYSLNLMDLARLGDLSKLGYLGFVHRPHMPLFHGDTRSSVTLKLSHKRPDLPADHPDQWSHDMPLYPKENKYTETLHGAPALGNTRVGPSIAHFAQQWYLERGGRVAESDTMTLSITVRHDADPLDAPREPFIVDESPLTLTAFFIDTWEGRINPYCRQYTDCTSCVRSSICHWCDLTEVAGLDPSIGPDSACGYTPIHCAILGGELFSVRCQERPFTDWWTI